MKINVLKKDRSIYIFYEVFFFFDFNRDIKNVFTLKV